MEMTGVSAYFPLVGTEKVHRTCNLLSAGVWMFLYGGMTLATFIAFMAVPNPVGGPLIYASAGSFLMSCLVYLWIRAIVQGSPSLMIPWMVHILMGFVSSCASIMFTIKHNVEAELPYQVPVPGWVVFLLFCCAGLLGLQFAYMFGMYCKLKDTKKHVPLADSNEQV